MSKYTQVIQSIKKLFGSTNLRWWGNTAEIAKTDDELYKETVKQSQEMMKKELAKMQVNFGDKDKYITGNPTFTPSQVEAIPQEQIKQIDHFTRQNNVIAEFYDSPPPISSSNLSAWEQNQPDYDPFPGMLKVEYKGWIILGVDEIDIEFKRKVFDMGAINHVEYAYPKEEFERRFYSVGEIPTYKEVSEDEWVGEDADKLNKIHNEERERLLKEAYKNTYFLSGIDNANTKLDDDKRI